MLIWNGFGILVPVIGFLALLIVVNVYKPATAPGGAPFLAFAIAALISAVATFGLAKGLVRRARILADEDPAAASAPHDFMAIPVRAWTFIFLAIAALFGYASYDFGGLLKGVGALFTLVGL